jgi:abequosyltransferase
MPGETSCKLSICIATYNRWEFIEATLKSVFEQASGDCESVVTDNASTDGTARLLDEYAWRYECLGYMRHDSNRGLDYNFDSSVMTALGSYCRVLQDDDRGWGIYSRREYRQWI